MYIVTHNMDPTSNDNDSAMGAAIFSCLRDMFQYSRLSGLHMLESVMNTALSAIARGNIDEACNVCVILYFRFLLMLNIDLFIAFLPMVHGYKIANYDKY